MAASLTYRSVCSGIEAATVAWEPLGFRALSFSEIEPFPCSVLAHRFPQVPNLGDMTQYHGWPDDEATDVLVGGTPCQSFSVAGLRKGIADPRGNLALVFLGLVDRYRPTWFVWENVPGVLSSDGGRCFGSFLGAVAQLGYGFTYRVLDAQFFGVPQRRRRVFVVGHIGDWRNSAAVLFEPESLLGNSSKGGQKKQEVAGTVTSGAGRRRGGGIEPESIIAMQEGLDRVNPNSGPQGKGWQQDLAFTLEARARVQAVAHTLRGNGFDASEDGTGRGTPLVPVHCFDARQNAVLQYGNMTGPLDQNGHTHAIAFSCKDHAADAGKLSPTLRAMGHGTTHANAGGQVAVAFAQNTRDEVREMAVVGALAAQPGMKQTSYIRQSMQVRRLTPRECERLQGFPDDWTLVPHRCKPAADGPRYKAIGNSMAVPVMRWIGERILKFT